MRVQGERETDDSWPALSEVCCSSNHVFHLDLSLRGFHIVYLIAEIVWQK